MSSSEQHEKYWENTKKQKALLVEPARAFAARARITFCVSRDSADDLNPPVGVEIEDAEEEATEIG